MIPRSYSDEGIVLARRNYAEADRILSVYSRNHGRISLIAKGVRKPISRKRGHLEVFSHIKFQAVNGKSLDLITEVETVENFPEVRKKLNLASLAYYFMEAVGRTTRENEPHPELFFLITKYLNDLKFATKLKQLKTEFTVEILETLGFWPKGKELTNPDAKLEEITERNFSSIRVGKRVLE